VQIELFIAPAFVLYSASVASHTAAAVLYWAIICNIFTAGRRICDNFLFFSFPFNAFSQKKAEGIPLFPFSLSCLPAGRVPLAPITNRFPPVTTPKHIIRPKTFNFKAAR
jgi:hypothetical protein